MIFLAEQEQAPHKESFKPSKIYIDLDRTLVDIDKAMDRLYAVLESMGVDVQAIKDKRLKIEAEGQSFEPISVINELFPNLEFEALQSKYANYSRIDIMYPDSRQFLKKLDITGIEYEVLTFGLSEVWQKMKITASGYTGKYTIIDHKNKTAIFAESQGSCLIDDKRECLQNMPRGCRGFWFIRDTEKREKIQKSEIPENVWVISTLGEILDFLTA